MDTRLKQLSRVLNREVHFRKNPQIAKLSKYVEFRNSRYYLSISEQECQQMGISNLDYQKILSELKSTNEYLAKVERKTGQGLARSNSFQLSTAIKGKLESTNQFQVSQKIFIPKGYKKVKFTGFRPNVTLGTIGKVGVSVMGGSAKREDFFLSSFFVRETEMSLDADNCSGEVFLQISAFGGGSVWWELTK